MVNEKNKGKKNKNNNNFNKKIIEEKNGINVATHTHLLVNHIIFRTVNHLFVYYSNSMDKGKKNKNNNNFNKKNHLGNKWYQCGHTHTHLLRTAKV